MQWRHISKLGVSPRPPRLCLLPCVDAAFATSPMRAKPCTNLNLHGPVWPHSRATHVQLVCRRTFHLSIFSPIHRTAGARAASQITRHEPTTVPASQSESHPSLVNNPTHSSFPSHRRRCLSFRWVRVFHRRCTGPPTMLVLSTYYGTRFLPSCVPVNESFTERPDTFDDISYMSTTQWYLMVLLKEKSQTRYNKLHGDTIEHFSMRTQAEAVTNLSLVLKGSSTFLRNHDVGSAFEL